MWVGFSPCQKWMMKYLKIETIFHCLFFACFNGFSEMPFTHTLALFNGIRFEVLCPWICSFFIFCCTVFFLYLEDNDDSSSFSHSFLLYFPLNISLDLWHKRSRSVERSSTYSKKFMGHVSCFQKISNELRSFEVVVRDSSRCIIEPMADVRLSEPEIGIWVYASSMMPRLLDIKLVLDGRLYRALHKATLHRLKSGLVYING